MMELGSALTCDEKAKYAVDKTVVQLNVDPAKPHKTINAKHSLANRYRNLMFYIAIMDCKQNLNKFKEDIENGHVKFEIAFT